MSFGRFLYILDISSSSYAWFKIFSLYHNTITITIIMVIDYYVKYSFLLVSCTWDSLILLICGFIDFIKFGIFSVFTFSNIFSSPYPLSLSTLITSILDTWNCSISHWFSIHLKKFSFVSVYHLNNVYSQVFMLANFYIWSVKFSQIPSSVLLKSNILVYIYRNAIFDSFYVFHVYT